MDVQIERVTFVGHSDSDRIVFACIVGGGYTILRNGQAVGIWGISDFAYCLGIYLRMINRPRVARLLRMESQWSVPRELMLPPVSPDSFWMQ